jgi:hypothetical protein
MGLYLYHSRDRPFETETDAAMNLPQDKSIFVLGRVKPGLSPTVQTMYSCPPDGRGSELEVTSGFLATEFARIKLGFRESTPCAAGRMITRPGPKMFHWLHDR